jgi:hypothetical protein
LDASPEDVDGAIVRAIQPLIAADPLKVLPQPQTVPAVLRQYEFVRRKVAEWEGRGAPCASGARCAVNKAHVLAALHVDKQWDADCAETLHLVALYGPDGTRCEDSRATDAIEGVASPTGKPAKWLLRLLREIDKEWAEEQASSDEESAR